MTSVFATESNHGAVVETESSNSVFSLNGEIKPPVEGALESPVDKLQQKRFNVLNLGFVDHGGDYPKSLELVGATLTAEMYIIFPGYSLWFSIDEEDEVLLQLFSDADQFKPISMVWAMYQFGMQPDDRIVNFEGHLIFHPGTYLCEPEGEQYAAEFNLLN